MKRTGLISRILVVCCTVAGITFLVLGLLTAEMVLVMKNASIHESIACSDKVISEVTTKTDELIERLSEKYGFDPATVKKEADREAVIQFAKSCVKWWMDIPQNGLTGDVPEWKNENIYNIVRVDNGFRSTVPEYEQRSTARDKIGYAIEKLISESVFPVRKDVIRPAFEMLSGRMDITRFTVYLPWIHALCLMFAFFITGVVQVLLGKDVGLYRKMRSNMFYATALLLVIFMLILGFAGIRNIVRESSLVMGMQAEMLIGKVLWHIGIMAGACFVAGLISGKERRGKNVWIF